jgi:predicted amidophosphoribosyltransferase
MRWNATATPPSVPKGAMGSGFLLKRLGLGVLDAVMPPHCLTCEEAVEIQGTLCGACFRGLNRITAPMCPRCGVPFLHAGQGGGGQGGAGGLCPGCLEHPPSYDTARAALRYDPGSQKLVLPFKHADRPELAGPLAAHMARAGAALLARCDLVAPVPLHWRRLFSRRYNQAALLAGRLARDAQRPCIPDLLRRRRATPPLGDLGAAARAALLADAFTIRPRAIPRLRGRRVLLVDDVMTSGATADACARALLEAGAAAVDVLAAARVPDPRLEAEA